jgi:hypothetical protein
MKRRLARWTRFLLVIGTCNFVASAQSYNLPSSGRFIASSRWAREVFNQCSRSAPSPKVDLWEPTIAEIDGVERSLAAYLANLDKAGKHTPPKKVSYHRQYVGFIRNGERYIYANFYPDENEFRSQESKHAIMVCDGGPAFWGIVYRVKAKTFEDPQFNGVA